LYLTVSNLSVMTTRFKKKEYATWIHPRCKKKHQIDHFIVNREMSHRVSDTGITSCLLDSDHQALFIKVRVMKRLKKKPEPHQKMLNLDLSELSNYSRNNLCQTVIRKLDDSTSPTTLNWPMLYERPVQHRNQNEINLNLGGFRWMQANCYH